MRLEQHIEIIRLLPVSHKRELLKLFFEVMEDHFSADGTITDGKTKVTVDQFISRVCFYVPRTQAIKPLGERRDFEEQSKRNVRNYHQKPSKEWVFAPDFRKRP